MAAYKTGTLELICILLASFLNVQAFSCGDSTTIECKTKFATTFSEDFKVIHLKAIRKVLNDYIAKGKAVSAELPKDDYVKPLLENAINKLSKDLENLNANVNDDKKLIEILEEVFEHMQLSVSNADRRGEKFDQLSEKYRLKQSLQKALGEMVMDTTKLWTELYSGLRSEDIKAYPVYETVNKMMEKVREPDGITPRGATFIAAGKLLGKEFNMKYFEAASDFI